MAATYNGPVSGLMRVMGTFPEKMRGVLENNKFPDGFVQKVTSCDKNCSECSYCGEVAILAGGESGRI